MLAHVTTPLRIIPTRRSADGTSDAQTHPTTINQKPRPETRHPRLDARHQPTDDHAADRVNPSRINSSSAADPGKPPIKTENTNETEPRSSQRTPTRAERNDTRKGATSPPRPDQPRQQNQPSIAVRADQPPPNLQVCPGIMATVASIPVGFRRRDARLLTEVTRYLRPPRGDRTLANRAAPAAPRNQTRKMRRRAEPQTPQMLNVVRPAPATHAAPPRAREATSTTAASPQPGRAPSRTTA